MWNDVAVAKGTVRYVAAGRRLLQENVTSYDRRSPVVDTWTAEILQQHRVGSDPC